MSKTCPPDQPHIDPPHLDPRAGDSLPPDSRDQSQDQPQAEPQSVPLGDPLAEAARRHARQRDRPGAASVARRLGQIGVLGWLIVAPMLLGTWAGRWADHRAGTAVFFTAPLMLAGLCLGCWAAWRWVERNRHDDF